MEAQNDIADYWGRESPMGNISYSVLQMFSRDVRGLWSWETGFSEVWGRKNLLYRWGYVGSFCPEQKKDKKEVGGAAVDRTS